METLVELRKVDKVYENGVAEQVLFDVDLSIRDRDFASLVGPSGSGKTTLLNIIGLLDTPTDGEVIVGGRDVSVLDEDARAQLRRGYLGFIFQFHHLLPGFSVLDNVLMPCRIIGRECEEEARSRAISMLEEVGLSDKIHSHPDQLSGGQQQRVAVVRAIVNEPDLVLADEPTGSLDSESSKAVMDLIRRINDETGSAFIIVTHDLDLAETTDGIIELRDGRIIRDDRTITRSS